jgi:hypothetical protein
MLTSKKIDETTIEISKEKPAEIIKTKYERSFIESQILAVKEQRDAYVEARNTELDELNAILAEMDKLQIVSKPVDISPVELTK